jgi:hypothetical protein
MAYAVAYCAHTWEMNALRGWAVAFLAYVATATGERSPWFAPTVVATAMGLVGTWASVAGNEMSIRLGRQRLVRLAMTSCVACGAVIGFLGARSYPLAAALVLLRASRSRTPKMRHLPADAYSARLREASHKRLALAKALALMPPARHTRRVPPRRNGA